MPDTAEIERNKCEHLGCNMHATMYCKHDKLVLCEQCAVTFHSRCQIFNIVSSSKSMFALKSVEGLVEHALLYSCTYWNYESKAHLQNELTDYKQQIEDLKRQLDISVSFGDFLQQYQLEDQILKFKNTIDSSSVIKEYLLESKY